jgi:hypothetical protein
MKATVGGEYAARVSVEPMSGNSGESMQIRPKGYGLVPFSPLRIAYLLILFYAAWINTYSNHVALVAMLILATGALATWVLTYHWRARIVVDSTDGTLQVRGRLISQTIHRRDISTLRSCIDLVVTRQWLTWIGMTADY